MSGLSWVSVFRTEHGTVTMPAVREEDREDALREAVADALARGFTSFE